MAAGTRFTLNKQVNLTQRLTKCQADLMQFHSWPLDYCTGLGALRAYGGDRVGVHLTKHQPDPQADDMSC